MLGSRTVLITCKVPRELVEAIDKMVEEGIFTSRSEAIRYAIGTLLSTNNDLVKGVRSCGIEERVVLA